MSLNVGGGGEERLELGDGRPLDADPDVEVDQLLGHVVRGLRPAQQHAGGAVEFGDQRVQVDRGHFDHDAPATVDAAVVVHVADVHVGAVHVAVVASHHLERVVDGPADVRRPDRHSRLDGDRSAQRLEPQRCRRRAGSGRRGSCRSGLLAGRNLGVSPGLGLTVGRCRRSGRCLRRYLPDDTGTGVVRTHVAAAVVVRTAARGERECGGKDGQCC